ncbi:MAG: hypothetical protein U1F55_07940 [Chitinivorax sp.]
MFMIDKQFIACGDMAISENILMRERVYLSLVSFFAPISSVVFLSSLQGTTPANLMLLLALFPFVSLIIFEKKRMFSVLSVFIRLVCIYFLVTVPPALYSGFVYLPDTSYFPRASNFPQPLAYILQSSYIVSGFLIYSIMRVYGRHISTSKLCYGAVFVCVFGLYEFLFFLIFKKNGDFLSNRVFSLGLASGSWFQTINIAGTTLMRVKSLTGEPSMLALTILPFFAYAYISGKRMMSSLFGITLVLSFSTSAYLGLLFVALSDAWIRKNYVVVNAVFVAMAVAIAGYMLVPSVNIFFESVVMSKFNNTSHSGSVRFEYFTNGIRFWISSPSFVKVFGVGFGTIRTTDLLTTLLINTGLVGVFLTLILFFRPLFYVNKNRLASALVCGVFVCLIVMLFSVPEYAYLTTWMFLGLLYSSCNGKVK